VFIGHAVRLAWLDSHPDDTHRYDEFKAQAWRSFYRLAPDICANYMVKALRFLTEQGQAIAV